jgi:hypothetical protein
MNRRGLFSAPIKIAFPHMNYIVYGYYGSYGECIVYTGLITSALAEYIKLPGRLALLYIY